LTDKTSRDHAPRNQAEDLDMTQQAGWYPNPQPTPDQQAPGGWYPQSPVHYPPAPPAPQAGSIFRENRFTWIAIAVAVAYVLIYTYGGVIFVGVLPGLIIARAFQRKERLAWLALAAAGGMIAYCLVDFLMHR
jgi:hypothetical protein